MNAPLTGLEEVIALPVLAPRPLESNKGSFGRVLVVSGSRGMSGAAVLCGTARAWSASRSPPAFSLSSRPATPAT
jgi:NAD(P)H-hydrate repair Nnr-like enzyme with NAD(P)H-hydrate dehydratase domain